MLLQPWYTGTKAVLTAGNKSFACIRLVDGGSESRHGVGGIVDTRKSQRKAEYQDEDFLKGCK